MEAVGADAEGEESGGKRGCYGARLPVGAERCVPGLPSGGGPVVARTRNALATGTLQRSSRRARGLQSEEACRLAMRFCVVTELPHRRGSVRR